VGQKTVRFSDLSGQLITRDDALARIVVQEHPELGDTPVEFEALTDEAMEIEKAALRVAVVELHLPGEDEPRRVTMDAAAFDQLATDKPMSELLITARPARRPARSASPAATRGTRVNYATLEHAGEPHKGKTTDAEKQLVRENLDEINERLAAQGLRTISLADPEHVERYGLEDLAQPQAESQDSGQLSAVTKLSAAGGEGGEGGEKELTTEAIDLTAVEMDLTDDADVPLEADELPEVQVAGRGRSRRR
jgi:hypothetical protein